MRRDGEPVSRAELVSLTGLSDRTVRDIVSDMNARSIPAIFDDKPPGGCRLGTKADCKKAAAVLRAKSGTMDRRAQGLERCYEPEPEPETSTSQEPLFA